MPRLSRIKSSRNIYHIMLRSVNKQQIFYDEEDYLFFISLLKKYKSVCGFELHAYCLMGNHIHLLLGAGRESLDVIFKRIGTAFVYWYNIKYERSGHLFQDRFRSEPVNDDRYFLTALRYILYNPVAAGICASPGEYAYSSAGEYIGFARGITDTEYAYQLIDRDELSVLLSMPPEDHCMDVSGSPRKRFTDTDAMELVLAEFGTYTPKVGKKRDRVELNRSIRRLIGEGISIRQLSRLTGISKAVIEAALYR